MIEQYGDFFTSITKLDDKLSAVRAVWNDQTAQTYDVFNENMQRFTKNIWACRVDSEVRRNDVKNGYRESEFDAELYELGSREVLA